MPDQPASQNPLTAFGPNEWLVDELYEQFKRDRNSVDKAWWAFFEDYQPGTSPQQASPPQQASSPQQATPPQQPSAKETAATPALAGDSVTEGPARSASSAETAPGSTAPKAAPRRPEKDTDGPGRGAPTPREAPRAAEPKAVEEDTITPIRGAAARVVSNMDASLQVPTATSVRSLPAKLLIDNRIVINNHLKRSRGGRSRSPTSSGTRWSAPSPRCRR